MKNVAIMIFSLYGGGAERIAGYLSKYLSERYNVYLFLTKTDKIVYDYGGTIVDIGKMGKAYEHNIKECKKKYKIDTTISFMERTNFTNIRTCVGDRLIISDRCVQSLMRPFESAEEIQIQKYYQYADEIVACSYGVKHDLNSYYHVNNNISVIYNFIDKDKITQMSLETLPEDVDEFLDGKDFLLTVGRLHPQKNHVRLIVQFALFHKKHPDVKLLILGKGVMAEHIQTLIDDKDLNDCVRIVPYEKNPFRYMSKAKTLVLSSHYEGLPNVVLEAMTIGTPVVAVDCLGGPRELLDDEIDYNKLFEPIKACRRGVLVSDSNSDDSGATDYLAKAMTMIYENKSLEEQVVINAKQHMETYSNEEILRQWLSVIEQDNRKLPQVLKEEDCLLKNAPCIILYGAGYIAHNTYLSMREKYKFTFCALSQKSEDDYFYDLPIKEIGDLAHLRDEAVVVMGVSQTYQNEVTDKLRELGFKNIIFPFIDKFRYELP